MTLPLSLETMRKLRRCREEMVLLIIGDGMERAAMERLAAAVCLPPRFIPRPRGRAEGALPEP